MMLRHTAVLLFTSLAFVPAPVFADQVTLKNGDRLSGTVLKYDGKNLTILSALAGAVTIPWGAVTEISAAQVHVGLPDGRTIAGAVKTSGGTLEIRTENTGTVAVAKDAIQFVRSKEEQAAWELAMRRHRNPRIVDAWTGSLDLGYSATSGNAETSTIAVNAAASRATSRDKISLAFTSLRASNNTAGVPVVTANAVRGGLRYNRNVTPRFFLFGSGDLEFDELQKLDLRIVPGGGFGHRIFKNERTNIELLGGASMNQESFSTGLRRTSAEVLLGKELSHKLSSITTLREKLVFYPNISNTGSYRINFDGSADARLFKFLSWTVAVSNRFLSNPVAGRQRNDVLFTTGPKLNFAR
jgi:putative salt-induced outer membrane protein YdiY